MNHLGDNYVDKHRNRPEVVIPETVLYVSKAATKDVEFIEYMATGQHHPNGQINGDLISRFQDSVT